MSAAYKLLFVGEPGAGKTTCIGAVSDIPPLVTDVECTDELALLKARTTVAFDYGELDLGDQGKLMLYGLPGQSRFKYMFEVVREGLLGVVVMVDATAPHAAQGLRETLECYAGELTDLPCVLALNKAVEPSPPLLRACSDLLAQYRVSAPMLVVDARRREDVVRLFELLFMLIEHGSDRKRLQPLDKEVS